MIKNDLSKFFVTKTEAAEFAGGLSAITQQIYQTGFSLEQAATLQFGVEKKDLFLQLLKDEDVNWQDNAVLTKYLTTLQEKIMKMPSVALQLAFVPKAETLLKIVDWMSLNTSGQVTLEIGVNKSLVGGATINFKGKFSDGSIRSKFLEAAYGSNVQ